MEITIVHRLELSPAVARILERMAFPGVNVVAAAPAEVVLPTEDPKPVKAPKGPKLAPAPAASEPAATAPEAPKAEPVVQHNISMDAVARTVTEVAKAIGTDNMPLLQALFKKFGGKSLPSVKQADYPEFVKSLLALKETVGKPRAEAK